LESSVEILRQVLIHQSCYSLPTAAPDYRLSRLPFSRSSQLPPGSLGTFPEVPITTTAYIYSGGRRESGAFFDMLSRALVTASNSDCSQLINVASTQFRPKSRQTADCPFLSSLDPLAAHGKAVRSIDLGPVPLVPLPAKLPGHSFLPFFIH
jgi:hypothetical protein